MQNVTTPTLIMVGEYDLRTPVPQSEEFYQALKIEGVPTKMIYMQNEWHGTSWYQTFRQYPWYDAEEHLSRSPLMFVENVTTPTLIMVGEYDLRTPVPQSEEFYQALKIEGVPTKMIYMQNEWHGTSRNPSNFLRTELYQLDWFEQYMTKEMKDRRMITDDTASQH